METDTLCLTWRLQVSGGQSLWWWGVHFPSLQWQAIRFAGTCSALSHGGQQAGVGLGVNPLMAHLLMSRSVSAPLGEGGIKIWGPTSHCL